MSHKPFKHALAGLKILVCLGSVALSYTSCRAANFYDGKTITLIVGNDAGTGFDAYGRLLARHMPRYLPGKPTIVVQNMIGAGSAIAAQFLYNTAPRDGTTFGLLTSGGIVNPLFESAKYHYEPIKFAFLGTAESLTRICFTSGTSKVKTFEDALKTKVVLGGTAPGNAAADYGPFLNAVAGTKFEVVNGYKSSAEILLAMERGEIEGVCSLDMSAVATMRPQWFGSRQVNFLVQIGAEPNKAMTKLGIPSIWNYIPEKNREIADLYISQQVFGRPFVAPPGIPSAQLKELRAAFMSAFQDPELLGEAKKMQLAINPKSGEDMTTVVNRLYSTSPDLVGRLIEVLKPPTPAGP